MNYDSRSSIESAIKRMLDRHRDNDQAIIRDLASLVLKAFEAGREQERRRIDGGAETP